jgi:hypothetical protein
MNFELTGISGHSPYDIYICDITDSYCYLVVSGVTTIPPSISLITPTEFNGVDELLIKVIDTTGCKFFRYFNCLAVTPTPTPVPTPTPTPIPTECLCISIYNPTLGTLTFSYIDCQGTIIHNEIQGSTTLYVCGRDTIVDDGLVIEVNDPCVNNTCPGTPVPTPLCYPVNVCELDGFCDVNVLNIVYPMVGVDFLDDKHIQPTCEELDSYDCALFYDKEETWRAVQNQYYQLYNANMLGKTAGIPDSELYNISFHEKYLTNPENETGLYKIGFRDVNMKYNRNNSEYPEWFEVVCSGQSLNDIFPGVEQFVFLPMVDDISQAPIGVVGDIIQTRNEAGNDYYWSPITNNWELLGDPDCVGVKIDDLFTIKVGSRNAILKSKNQLVLALRPYLYSGYYLPAWHIKKYKGF